MKDKLLHTPDGVRDIYSEELIRKEKTESAIKKVMRQYGFLQIKTPAFEYFDIFSSERGTVDYKNVFRFTDRDGDTLAMRPDITPQIARCVAKYYKNEANPIRLFYNGDTFVNNSGLQGKLREISQIGAELINVSEVAADAEMIALMIDSVKAIGLSDFQIEVGNADFFRGLTEASGFSESETDELRQLIEAKNIFGVEELLSRKDIDESIKELLMKLPLQFGSIEFIKSMKEKTTNERALKALLHLEDIYEKLCVYDVQQYVSFDLGMLSQFDYYTGVVFKAYTHKTGEPIAAGGRYDKLLSQFGKPAPAIGIAIYVDYALSAMQRQGVAKEIIHDGTLIVYTEGFENNAIKIAKSLREDNLKIAMMRKPENYDEAEVKAYAESILARGILHVDNESNIRITDVVTGETVEKEL